jgi:sugar phosphate isomerase/epimerase
VFVACSTLCFAGETLEKALRLIAEMEFDKFELAIVEDGQHLRPSEIGENLDAAMQRLRRGPSLSPSSIYVDYGSLDSVAPATLLKRFESTCRLAKALGVAVLTTLAAPIGSPIDAEIQRLASFAAMASREGLVLSILTHSETIAGDPSVAARLCKTIPTLGLTLDPSHFIQGPFRGADVDPLLPLVQNVHFRDTGKEPGAFQVRVGQGEVEYGKIVTQLQRCGYKRALTVCIVDRPDNLFDREVEVRKLKLLLESLL